MNLKYFDSYVKLGFQPIAIYKDAKCPIGINWNKNWSIERWRPFFEEDDRFNMGILLGSIIDVEGDTREANDLLNKLIGDTPHPKFSSSKSIHHLFLSPDPNLTRYAFDGIEFRGKNHQSVLPPSKHNDGMTYQWLRDSSMPVPHLPIALREFLFEHIRTKSRIYQPRRQLKRGHVKTICKCCKKEFFIHRKRLALEVQAFLHHNLLWSCRGCRNIDVREECRYLKRSSH